MNHEEVKKQSVEIGSLRQATKEYLTKRIESAKNKLSLSGFSKTFLRSGLRNYKLIFEELAKSYSDLTKLELLKTDTPEDREIILNIFEGIRERHKYTNLVTTEEIFNTVVFEFLNTEEIIQLYEDALLNNELVKEVV